jgi:hypothetical protein
MRTAGPSRTARRRAGAVAIVAALAVVLAGCSGNEPGTSATSTGSGGSPAGVSAALGSAATAYPVAADAKPQALPSLGTRQGDGYTVTINSLQRVGPQAGLLTATVTAASSGPMQAFTEPGYNVLLDPQTKKPLGGTYDFSAVTVAAKGDPTVYQVMRDEQQRCACTTGMLSVQANVPFGVYAYVTLPMDADTVTVSVKGLAPFADIKVAA